MTDYPYPIYDNLPLPVSEHDASAYEQTLVQMVREELVGRPTQIPRMINAAELSGTYPDTRLVIHYTDKLDRVERTATWTIWKDVPQNGIYDPAAAVGGYFAHQWDAGEIS